jgi:hypothetical protein
MAREEGRGGGKGTHACRLSGKGCSMWNCAEGLNSNPCTPHEGRGASRQAAIILSSICHSDRPVVRLRCPSRAPFLCRIARVLRYSLYHTPIRNRFARLRAWQTREESSSLPEPADNRQVANSCRVLATSRVRPVGYSQRGMLSTSGSHSAGPAGAAAAAPGCPLSSPR